MSDTVAAYWGPREASPEEAAEALSQFLQALDCPVWFEKGSASPQPNEAVDTSKQGLADLFAKGVNRRDADKSVMPELGYRVSVWNGDTQNPVELSAQCGVTSTTPGVSNSVVLKLPSTSAWRDRSDTVFKAVVDAFSPDRAIWMTAEYRRTQPKVDSVTMFGWLTFLTDVTAARLEAPAGVETTNVGNGVVFRAGSEPGQDSTALAARLATQLV